MMTHDEAKELFETTVLLIVRTTITQGNGVSVRSVTKKHLNEMHESVRTMLIDAVVILRLKLLQTSVSIGIEEGGTLIEYMDEFLYGLLCQEALSCFRQSTGPDGV